MNQEVLRYADWYWWLYGVNVHELLGEKEKSLTLSYDICEFLSNNLDLEVK